MGQTTINIRMDEDLKKQFDLFCTTVGMNMTTAICIFAKTVVREQRIPFELRAEIPNDVTIAAIKEGKEIIKDSSVKSYKDIDSLRKALDV